MDKKTIVVLTATRAEYGLLKPIIRKLMDCGEFHVKIAATGAHLSPEFGSTYREIETDGFVIDKKIEMLLSSDTAAGISKSMGLALISFAEYFEAAAPDALIVLGDRYETLAVCCAAMNAGIPIIHLYGGETTEGAIDEAVRHAITKMSYLHCTSTEEYKKRVIQLGEEPERVFCVGAVGIENIMNMPLFPLEELEQDIGMPLKEGFAVVTFHPVTLEYTKAGEQFEELLSAVQCFPDIKFIFTKANADTGGRIINRMIDAFAAEHKNCAAFESLGVRRYLSAVKYSSFVLGNSSSGLVEVPSFHVPTINIGDRQKGRIRAESVLDCVPEKNAIEHQIRKALNEEFRKTLMNIKNPYGDGHTSDMIVDVIREFMKENKINLKKKFYNIPF